MQDEPAPTVHSAEWIAAEARAWRAVRQFGRDREYDRASVRIELFPDGTLYRATYWPHDALEVIGDNQLA